MPSTIIGSASWNATGLVLSQQTAQEQVTGLVNVQLTYVCPASKQHALARSFYLDAPPPIFPSVVTRAELLTNNLYMVTRTVERMNGLCYIRAEYAGGLRRAGFRGYFQRETLELRKKANAYDYYNPGPSAPINVTGASSITLFYFLAFGSSPDGTTRRVTNSRVIYFDERIQQLAFVRIGQEQAISLPTFYRSDLVALAPRSTRASTADVWFFPGDPGTAYEKTTPILGTESSEYVTPRVQVITRTYRLGN